MIPADSTIQIIIEGGAVGLALVALGLIWYCLKLIGNHLTDVTSMLGRVAQVLEMVVDRLDGRNGSNDRKP